jgi:hypothetical protein
LDDEGVVGVEGHDLGIVMEGDGGDEQIERADGETAVAAALPYADGLPPKAVHEWQEWNGLQLNGKAFAFVWSGTP